MSPDGVTLSGDDASGPLAARSPAPCSRVAWWCALALALALAHFCWIAWHHSPATMGPDSNGYIVQARLMANEGRTGFSPESPVQFVGMHWLEAQPGVFHSRYPGGLPLLMASAWKVGGLAAATWVNPVLASATLVLVFLLARRIVRDALALWAALVVAAIPTTNQHALDADAHVAAAFFLVAGVLLLLRFAERPSAFAGLAGGLCLGIVPTMRYPEAIVGLPIAAWLLWRVRPRARMWPAVAGALLPLALLCAHNAAAYGAFWKTGYALTNEQTGFGFDYFVAHVIGYLVGLSGQGFGLMFAFGVAGIAALAAGREHRAAGWLFAGIVVPLTLLYMAYYFGGGGVGGAGGNMRFLVPTFPFLAAGGAWVLDRMIQHLGRPGWVAAGVVLALQLTVGLSVSTQMLGQFRRTLASAAKMRMAAERDVPAGAILIADRMLAESLDASGRWRLVDEGLLAGGMGPGPVPDMGPPGGRAGRGPGPQGGPARGGGPAMGPGGDGRGPSPQQIGKNQAQLQRYAGLTREERRARIWSDVAAWAGARPVFWLTRSLELIDNALPSGGDFRSIAEMDAPSMTGPMMGPGGGGPGTGPGGPGFAPKGPPVRGGRGGMMGPPDGGAGRGGFGPPGMGPGGGPSSKLRLVQIELPPR